MEYKIEKQNIIFYEIPYNTRTEDLLAEIGKACDEKEIEGIADVRDESNKKGLRLVIECQKNASIETIIRKLFAKTNLQNSISYNQVALIDKTPVELNLKDCIEVYIKHNIECIVREAEFDRKKALDRLEIVELSSYTEYEKFEIARRHLIEKQIKLNGLETNQLEILEKRIKKDSSGR